MNPEEEKSQERGKDSAAELRKQVERQSPVTAPRVGDAIREGMGDRQLQQYETDEAQREGKAKAAGAPSESSAEKSGDDDVTPVPGFGTGGSAPPD